MLECSIFKRKWILIVALMMGAEGLLLPIRVQAQNTPGQQQPKKSDSGKTKRVDDAGAAIRIAERALSRVYGDGIIKSERPFTAFLEDGVWHVGGTLHCKDKKGKEIPNGCFGGVATAQIRQSDGRVLRMEHTK